MYTCKRCERIFEKRQSYASHSRHCALKAVGLNSWDVLSDDGKERCRQAGLKNKKSRALCKHCNTNPVNDGRAKFCSSSCSASYHNPGKKQSEVTRNKIRAGIARYVELSNRNGTVKTTKRICPVCSGEFTAPTRVRKTCSKECGIVQAASTLKSKPTSPKVGGYRERSGNSNCRGTFHGIYCGSSYELIFVAYQKFIGKDVQRSRQILTYVYEDKLRRYHPDFEVEGITYEVKGFFRPTDCAKLEQHADIKVVATEEIMWMKSQVPYLRDLRISELRELLN